jgi:RND family efflux transporter MFP subunit
VKVRLSWTFQSLLCSALVVGGLLAWAGRPALGADASAVTGIDTIAIPQYDKKLAFGVPGRVRVVNVKPGQAVQAGQLLMELEDEKGKAMVARYEVVVASDVEERIAKENLALAKIEEGHLRELIEKQAAAPIELERAIGKTNLANLDVEKAHKEHQEHAHELEEARADHEQYRLLAPVSGVIQEVNFYEGQAVEVAKPVLRLVVTDPLWVEVPVATAATLGLTEGTTAEVHSAVPGFELPLAGKVIFVAPVADAASETRLIRVEVPNPTHLPAGTKVTIDFPSAPVHASR